MLPFGGIGDAVTEEGVVSLPKGGFQANRTLSVPVRPAPDWGAPAVHNVHSVHAAARKATRRYAHDEPYGCRAHLLFAVGVHARFDRGSEQHAPQGLGSLAFPGTAILQWLAPAGHVHERRCPETHPVLPLGLTVPMIE